MVCSCAGLQCASPRVLCISTCMVVQHVGESRLLSSLLVLFLHNLCFCFFTMNSIYQTYKGLLKPLYTWFSHKLSAKVYKPDEFIGRYSPCGAIVPSHPPRHKATLGRSLIRVSLTIVNSTNPASWTRIPVGQSRRTLHRSVIKDIELNIRQREKLLLIISNDEI